MRSQLFTFPDPVNEHSARLVALGVVTLTLLILALRLPVLIVPLSLGFIARVLTGPTLSPLGQFVTRVATPMLGRSPKLVPGPPKRFAQAIGATLSTAALILYFGFGFASIAYALVAAILVAASLEAFAGFCLGCYMFARLITLGMIPADVCARCADISLPQEPQLV